MTRISRQSRRPMQSWHLLFLKCLIILTGIFLLTSWMPVLVFWYQRQTVFMNEARRLRRHQSVTKYVATRTVQLHKAKNQTYHSPTMVFPYTSEKRWFWIGIVHDAVQVQDSTWDALFLVACANHAQVHIVVGQNEKHAFDQLITQRAHTVKGCSPIYIETEQQVGISNPLPTNRVERIALIRDAQRQRLRTLWSHGRDANNQNIHDDVVIVADLDLFRLPPVNSVLAQAQSMNDLDVVCAAGVTMASTRELWYYDTYATVLLPDTYVHPLKRRLVKQYSPEEDPKLVRSDNQHGSFTQGDLMKYLQQQATESGTVRVRSCFGGLSIYRATTFFQELCSYTQRPDQNLERYASESDGRPCEHVVFQTCLQDDSVIPKANIAINPSLLTLWRKD